MASKSTTTLLGRKGLQGIKLADPTPPKGVKRPVSVHRPAKPPMAGL